jgi:DMSO/TMAO reductase YedYZ molybdopterin-dependent catalytic subunit
MQVLKQNKKIILITALLLGIIVISFFVVQNAFKPSVTNMPSPTSTPGTTSTANLYPGEITQYQGQNLSPIASVYQNAIAGTQYINQSTYHLEITGLVNNTLEYTYNQVVNDHQKYQKVVTITCVEGWSATILWEGILVNDLLQEAGVNPNATTVIFHAADGYTTELPLDYIVQNHIMIAYKMNNVTLTAGIGWPFMVVAQDQYGYKWAKWLTEIEVSNNTNYLGYWESRGYPNNANTSLPP